MAKKERAVLVTTSHRGVFFGYANDVDGSIIKLKRARNCLYWGSDVRGFIGLAVSGPTKSCRVGPPASELALRDITSVAEVSDEAAEKWEGQPWSN